MDSIWNDVFILPPPINTYKINDGSLDTLKLNTVISDSISYLEDQKVLHREAGIISRMIYIMGRKFRHDIGHSYMRRTNTALLKYLNFNIIKDLQSFLSVVPLDQSDIVYVPTRQMLEFILIRFQTFSKIMCRICTCAQTAASFYFERLRRGHSAWLSLVPYTALSRIWVLSGRLLKNSCNWYNELLPFRNILKLVGVSIVPPDYSFPDNLLNWLDIDTDKQFKISSTSANHDNVNLGNVINDESSLVHNSEDKILFVEQNNSSFSKKNRSQLDIIKMTLSKNQTIEDFGEKVSRCDFVKTNSNIENKKVIVSENTNFSNVNVLELKKVSETNSIDPKISTNAVRKHSINSVNNLKTLNKFLRKEEKYRLNNDSRSLTVNIGLMQWLSLKKILIQKMEKFCNNKLKDDKITKKILKIWTKRCTQ